MQKNNLKTQAYNDIKSKILNCDFPPGMLLNESLLCEILSISRTPIRDALSRLEHEHLVRIFPPKGVLVEDITIRDLSSYFETRLTFEPSIVFHHGKNVDKHELIIFSDYISDLGNLNKPNKFFHILSAFHNIFVEESANPYLIQLYDHMNNLEQRLLILLTITPSQLETLPPLYHDFLSSCLSAQWNKAQVCMVSILQAYRDIFFMSYLDFHKNNKTQHGGTDEKK